jgi:DNA-binding GntR family transcriptional regulator
MLVDDDSDPRAYVKLAAEVRNAVTGGMLKPGTAAPSIAALAEQYGHARQTCSKALGILVQEGLLVRYPGLGYYVTGKPGD